ncbi:hypothetical protein O3P69_003191 [Scylla paramamosain]|uniref:Uncharacterized protein n=1 Tax=Scylla paramamosain TaxID=85552 RepID=A0AAW0UJH3_SCYPA
MTTGHQPDHHHHAGHCPDQRCLPSFTSELTNEHPFRSKPCSKNNSLHFSGVVPGGVVVAMVVVVEGRQSDQCGVSRAPNGDVPYPGAVAPLSSPAPGLHGLWSLRKNSIFLKQQTDMSPGENTSLAENSRRLEAPRSF